MTTRSFPNRRAPGRRRFLLLAAIAVTALAAGAKDKRKQAPYAVIFVTVFQEESGLSLPGARVEIVPAGELRGEHKFKKLEAVSDSRGELAFHVPVEEMTYKLTARAAGYTPQDKTMQAAGEVRVDVFFRLEAASRKTSEAK
jgi:hypothetical protein